jgi:hypothetical protein
VKAQIFEHISLDGVIPHSAGEGTPRDQISPLTIPSGPSAAR